MFGFVKNYFCGKSGEQAPDPSSEDLEHSFSTSEMTAHPIPLASRMNNTTRSNRGEVTDLYAEIKCMFMFKFILLRSIYICCGRLTLGFHGPRLYHRSDSSYATL
jgi:hypothetical protein